MRNRMAALLILVALGASAAFATPAITEREQATSLVKDLPTTQYFTLEAPSGDDLTAILAAGVNAPSGLNHQPWHFSVTSNKALLACLANETLAAIRAKGGPKLPPVPKASVTKASVADVPMAIIISCRPGSEFDAGLACETMAIEAQLLGWGSKIVASPTVALNGPKQAEYKQRLGIPADMQAVALVLLGREDKTVTPATDGYTGPTPRNPFDSVVTFADQTPAAK